MRLTALRLKNFRSYQDTTTINFNDLTALIGKNDVGKSTILEALEIFFNDDVVSMDQNDLNIYAKENNDQEIDISCLFTDLSDELIIDFSADTNLREEHTNLVVISTHGHSGLTHFLLGSTAEKVAQHSICPILTLKPDYVRNWE